MPFFPGTGGPGRRHYEALELEPTATPEEIKRAYRRLALQHHPDKGGSPEKFKEISTAHTILSDPDKRQIYDQYGEEGLNILESGMFGEEGSEILPFILKPHFRGIVFLLALLSVCIIVLVPIFIVIRTDGAVHWSWGAVFTPIWILLAVYNSLTIALIYIGKNPNKLNPIRFAVQSILLTIFFAFICARLDGRTTWDAAAYLAPLYAIELLNTTKLFPKSTKQSFINEAQGGEGTEKRSFLGAGYVGFIFRIWFWWLHRVWFLIFLTVQLDNNDWSWWIVAIPILTATVFGYALKIADDRVEANSKKYAQPEEEEEAKGGNFMTSALFCVLGSLLIIFLGLLVTHLDRDRFSVAVVFIPIFIVLGLVLCCCICCVPCICCMMGGDTPLGGEENGPQSPRMPDFFGNRQRLLMDSPSPSSSSSSSSPSVIVPMPHSSSSSSSSSSSRVDSVSIVIPPESSSSSSSIPPSLSSDTPIILSPPSSAN